MLHLTLSAKESEEFYDERTNQFIIGCPATSEAEVKLEHSLLSISKWEQKWKKPYLSDKYEKTPEMIIDYIRCMAVDPKYIPALERVNEGELRQIGAYIEDSMTATKVGGKSKPSREIITSELVYGWMVLFRIPFSCEKWHLNRLLMLIGVCGELNNPPKKGAKKSDISKGWADVNRARREALGSSG